MKRLDTSSTSTTNGFPPKQGTWDFLQDAHTEVAVSIVRAIIGKNYDDTIPYCLFGIEFSSPGIGLLDISPGAIFFNGMIYMYQGYSGSSGIVSLWFRFKDISYTVNADPVQFTGGGAPINVHISHEVELFYDSIGTGSFANVNDMNRLYGNWTSVISYQGTYTEDASNKLQTRLSFNRFVEIQGRIYNSSVSVVNTNVYVAKLPLVSMYPSTNVSLCVLDRANRSAMVEIQTNGEIHLRGDILTTGTTNCYLSHSFGLDLS